MAKWELSQWICLLCILPYCSSQFLFDSLLGDEPGCEGICENSYPLHTYDKPPHLGYCLRGCRLFSIIDFVNDCNSLNDTRDSCVEACEEAYTTAGDQDACSVGCRSQLPFTQKKHDLLAAQEEQMWSLQPYLYVHGLYSNMVDKVSDQLTVSWSYFVQADNGLVIIRSERPRLTFQEFGDSDEDGEYKTSNYIETNLAFLDNSATPNLKNSQVNGLERLPRDLDLAALEDENENLPPDWLSCVSSKTGLPRLLLSMTIFLAAIVMIWLCVTAIATAPEQRVPKQKLSIYGDLEYLQSIDDKALLSLIHPQDMNQNASPLPIKIKVQQI